MLFFYLPGIGARDLWNPDEPRYAQVASEMLAGGTAEAFFVPRLNGELYTQKPPLLFWSMAFFGWLGGGMNEEAARGPSLLAALLAVLFVYRLGRLLFDRQVGWSGALVFGSTFKIVWQGHVGQIDMLLTALVTVAVYGWARAWVAGIRAGYWQFFGVAGLATLAKGPVGLLPPLLSILVFTAWRDRAALKELPLFRGLLLWVAVVMAWLGPALYWGGEPTATRSFFARTSPATSSPGIITSRPGTTSRCCRWISCLGRCCCRAPAACLGRGSDGPWRERFYFLLTWVVSTLVFFSASPAKRTVYILTLYPALALVVGLALALAVRRVWTISVWWWRVPIAV